MSTMVSKNYRIENIRALAIIMVVFVHSVILYSDTWGVYHTFQQSSIFQLVSKAISLCFMYLFFSISGFLFANSTNNTSFMCFVEKKIKRLIIPFFFVGLCVMIPIKMLLGHPNYIGVSYLGAVYHIVNGMEVGHLWFLPVLFFTFLCAYVIVRIFGNRKVVWFVVFIISLLSAAFFKVPYAPYYVFLRYFNAHFWSFAFGAFLFNVDFESTKKHVRYIILLITAALVYLSIRRDSFPLSLITSVLMTLCFFLFVPDIKNGLAEQISKNSYGIYLFHSPLIYITFTYLLDSPPFIVFAVNFIFFGGIAYLLSMYLNRTPLKYLLGMWK